MYDDVPEDVLFDPKSSRKAPLSRVEQLTLKERDEVLAQVLKTTVEYA